MKCFTLVLAAVLAAGGAIARAAESKGKPMSYGETREFLAKHTQLVELTNDDGARVAVCPEWQGRVMTSTCGGLDGPSFGFVNDEFITAGKPDPHFNNYGAEERLWLSPEGGQFSLWFAAGKPQDLDNWFTPPAFNEGAWKVVSGPNEPLRMAATMKFGNTSGTQFHLDVSRGVRLLGNSDLKQILGESAAKKIAAPGVKNVAYESDNRLTNRGADMTREKGLVSLWILGMMNSGPQTVIIVPYKAGQRGRFGARGQVRLFRRRSRRAVAHLARGRTLAGRRQLSFEDRHFAAACPQRARFDRFPEQRAHAGPLQHAGRSDARAVHEQPVGRPDGRALQGRRGQQLQRRPSRARQERSRAVL